jgi:Kef-type K+ transport system membrane component KefB
MPESGVIPLLAAIALVIAAAKIAGYISSRLHQPAVLGELLAGLLLGPSLLNVFGQPYFAEAHVAETLHELGEIGVIFLMFAAGLEIHLSDFLKTGRTAVYVGVLGVFAPILLGAGTTLLFGPDMSLSDAIFMGIVLGATSVSISAQTLMELGLLRSREGLTLLGAAVVDDVLAIAILSLFVAVVLSGGGSALSLIWIVVRMALFLGGAFLVGMYLLPRFVNWSRWLPVSQPIISTVIIVTLLFAWASEALGGVAAITGAFIAGVGLSRSAVRDEIERGMRSLTYGFFVPIFLVGIGLVANARELSAGAIGFAVIISIVAIISKLIGGALGARLGQMSWIESTRVGVGMISRGEVGLIIAGVGTSSGIIANELFTVVVVMVLVTTIAAPPLLRLAFRGKEVERGRPSRASH